MMNKVKSSCRVAELNTLAGRIIDLYNSSDLKDDTNLSAMIKELIPLHKQFTSAINKELAQTHLANFDEAINNTTRSLFSLVEGFTFHPDTNIKTAADKLQQLLNNYGRDIIYESYAIQTSLVDSLLNDLAQANHIANVQLLSGCDLLVKKLIKDQSNFKSEYITYEKNKVSEKEEQIASLIKKEVLILVNKKLILYITVMSTINNSKYNAFATALEQIIDTINQNVTSRTKAVAQV